MLSSLRQAVEQHLRGEPESDGAFATPIPGLVLMRSTGTAVPRKGRLHHPSLCLVVQGAKEMAVGDRVLTYRENQALVVSFDVPAFGRVIEASPARPYLAVALELDPGPIVEILGELPPATSSADAALGLFVVDVDEALGNATERLLRLIDTPAALPVLGRQTLREVYYWLLTGPHGPAIARLVSPDGHAQRIGRAIRALRENFDKPLRVADLAGLANMSPSSFHQHFKSLTAMSPLQYQKQLRLLEARRLIAADPASIAAAAYRVGYESPSQFSREYARMFGMPPRRHAGEAIASAH